MIVSDHPMEWPVVRKRVMEREGNERTKYMIQKCAVRIKQDSSL